MQLAFGSPMFPEHYHKKFENKEDFGAKPIGTGPYRIVQLDKNTGTIASSIIPSSPRVRRRRCPRGCAR